MQLGLLLIAPISLCLQAAVASITISGFESYGECNRHHNPSPVTLKSKCTNVNLGQDILYFWTPEVSIGCTVTIYAIADCPAETLLQEATISDLCTIADLPVLSIGLSGCPGDESGGDIASSSSASISAPSVTPQNAGNAGIGGAGSNSGSSSGSDSQSNGSLSGAALIATIVSPIITVVISLLGLAYKCYRRKAKERAGKLQNVNGYVQVQRPIPMGFVPPQYHYGM